MKRYLLLVILLSIITCGYAGTLPDSLKQVYQKVDSVEKAIAPLAKDVQALLKQGRDTLKPAAIYNDPATGNTIVYNSNAVLSSVHELGFWEWVLVFLPVGLLIAIMTYCMIKLGSFKLAAALTENELPKITVANSEYTTANLERLKDKPELLAHLPATVEVSAYGNATDGYQPAIKKAADTQDSANPPSISRLIALLSGLLIIVVGVSMTSLFIYEQIRTRTSPDLSKLSSVLLALGFGVAPYIVNKVSGALASRSSNTQTDM
jgi:hypothetical protein